MAVPQRAAPAAGQPGLCRPARQRAGAPVYVVVLRPLVRSETGNTEAPQSDAMPCHCADPLPLSLQVQGRPTTAAPAPTQPLPPVCVQHVLTVALEARWLKDVVKGSIALPSTAEQLRDLAAQEVGRGGGGGGCAGGVSIDGLRGYAGVRICEDCQR